MLRTEKKVSGTTETVSVTAKFDMTYLLLVMLAIPLVLPAPGWYMSILTFAVWVDVGLFALGTVFSISMLFVVNKFAQHWRGTLANRPLGKVVKGFVIVTATLAMMTVLGYDNAVYAIAGMYMVISIIGMYLRARGV